MATGDIRNNLRKLQKQVSLIRYPDELDYEGLTKGEVSAYLPLLYYAFFHFSPHVVENIAKMEYNLAGKRDAAFITVVFKIIRERTPKFSLNLKVAQFMSKGFAERKIILTSDILLFVRTSPQLRVGKSHVRPPSAVAMAGPASRSLTKVEVAEISEIKPDITAPSEKAFCAERFPGIVAPKMQSTSRGMLQDALPQAVDSLCSTIKATLNGPRIVSQDDSSEPSNLSIGTPKANDVVTEGGCCRENNEELKNLLLLLQHRQESLESENKKMKCDLEEMKMQNMKMKKELEACQCQQPLVDLANVIARLDVIESKALVIENSVKVTSTESQDPVCHDNLKVLQLQRSNSVDDPMDVIIESKDNSLSDVTNKSQQLHSRNQRMKLLDLVQGTRSLLGMSDMSDLKTVESVTQTAEENMVPKQSITISLN